MSRLYVGGLPDDADKNEIEREFEYFGALRDVWIARNPPGFGFVVFEDSRDAEDAVRELDGKRVLGSRIRVEFARSGNRGGGRGRGRGRGGGGGYNSYRSYDRGGDRYSSRSNYRDRSRSPDRKRRRHRSRSSSYDRKRKDDRDRSRSKTPSQ